MEKNMMIKSYRPSSRITGRLRDESGIVLVAALLVMVFLTFVGTTVMIVSSSNVKVSRNNNKSSQAFMVAEAGVAQAIDRLRTDPNWPDMDGNGIISTAEDTRWLSDSEGEITLSGQNGGYTITLFDTDGTHGRESNTNRTAYYAEKYADLDAAQGDVLIEVDGTVDGFTRTVSVIVRGEVAAYAYTLFSEGTITGTSGGANPGTINGQQYGKTGINWRGNYDLSQSDASTSASIMRPACHSGRWQKCESKVPDIEAPMLNFAFYQDQNNFNTTIPKQQVVIMTPTAGGAVAAANCTGIYRDNVRVGCDETWLIRYEMNTLGNIYTLTSRMEVRREGGGNWDHEVFYCANPDQIAPWNGIAALCPDGMTAPTSFTFTSDARESRTKPFIDAVQFKAYTDPTDVTYTSSIVNVFDSTAHMELLGPQNVEDTTTINASILVGTAADNTSPIGKLDIEGGAGELIFAPENGLAIVAEVFKVVAKFSPINVRFGSTTAGAIIIAKNELVVEGDSAAFNVNMTLNGSAIVGGDAKSGGADNSASTIYIGANTTFDANYVKLKDHIPAGYEDLGSVDFQRREWREL